MKKTLLFIAVIAAISVSCMSFGIAAAKTFPDVNEDNTNYYDAIMWMADNGVISGHPDGTFKPDDCVNRAEMLKMLFLSSGTDLNDMAMGGLYPDVDPNAWYYLYVKKASLMGIVEGYPDGYFRPEQCVNRVEAIKMGVNQFGIEDFEYDEYPLVWLDIDENAWYAPYFEKAAKRALIGTFHSSYIPEDGGYYYGPAEPMTRKEAAEMLYRMKSVTDNQLGLYDAAYEPFPIINEFAYDENVYDYYGALTLTGYANIQNVPEAWCDPAVETCGNFDYLYFEIASTDNTAIYDYIADSLGNSYIGEDYIGLGCVEDGVIHYFNYSDVYGMQELYLNEDLSSTIINSTSENPITIKLTRYMNTGGVGAPTCYSHFKDVEVM